MATTVATTAGSLANLTETDLLAGFGGRLIAPDDPEYDEARAVYNGMIDRRPGLIAQCEDVADVLAAVGLARRHGLLVSIRGGGHNAGGLAVADGGLCIDLRPMHGVHVEPGTRIIHADGGATWGQVDHAAHAFGLTVPCGIISTTGVGGLTLGGGIGHLARRYGLTVDNLIGADVVLADGRFVTATEDDHPDLLWALRGGGGNFGVVTSFTYRGAPVDVTIAGPTFWRMDQAAAVMRFYDTFMQEAPRELNGFFAFLSVPPDPAFPTHLHGQTVCGVVWCWCGSAVDADQALAPVRNFGPPAFDGIGPAPMPALNSAFDALYEPGMQWYWKADFVKELTPAAIAAHVKHGAALPTMHSTMHLYPIDGAVGDVASDATAFARRDARWAQVVVGVDPDPARADEIRAWAQGYYEATHPHASDGAYVNFLMHDEGPGRVQASYGDNYARLQEVKRRYDPTNLFRVNQNVEPA